MRRALAVAASIAVVLFSATAGAPPPLPMFPASVRPLSGNAPFNTRIWAFGANAPPVADVSFALTIDGAPAAVQPQALGCCAMVATLPTPRTGTATIVVTSPAAALSATFVIVAGSDTTAPALGQARILDDLGGRLVIGVEGTDDFGLAGFIARVGGEVRGTAPPGYLLETTRGPDGCVSVTAVDFANNESPVMSVCGARPDGGVADDAGAADSGGDPEAPEGCGCSSTAGRTSGLAPLGLLILGLGLFRRRPKFLGSLPLCSILVGCGDPVLIRATPGWPDADLAVVVIENEDGKVVGGPEVYAGGKIELAVTGIDEARIVAWTFEEPNFDPQRCGLAVGGEYPSLAGAKVESWAGPLADLDDSQTLELTATPMPIQHDLRADSECPEVDPCNAITVRSFALSASLRRIYMRPGPQAWGLGDFDDGSVDIHRVDFDGNETRQGFTTNEGRLFDFAATTEADPVAAVTTTNGVLLDLDANAAVVGRVDLGPGEWWVALTRERGRLVWSGDQARYYPPGSSTPLGFTGLAGPIGHIGGDAYGGELVAATQRGLYLCTQGVCIREQAGDFFPTDRLGSGFVGRAPDYAYFGLVGAYARSDSEGFHPLRQADPVRMLLSGAAIGAGKYLAVGDTGLIALGDGQTWCEVDSVTGSDLSLMTPEPAGRVLYAATISFNSRDLVKIDLGAPMD